MDNKDLRKLKKFNPQPDTEARKRAISAAMEAFDAEHGRAGKKNEKNSQGFTSPLRHIHSSTQQLWSFIMKKQMIAGTAMATALTVLITTSVLHNPEVMRDLKDQTLPKEEVVSSQAVEMEMDAGVASKPADADLAIAPQEQFADTRAAAENIAPAPATKVMRADRARSSMMVMDKAQAMAAASMQESRAAAPPARLAKEAFVGGAMGNSVGIVAPLPAADMITPAYHDEGRDHFENVEHNPIKKVSEDPVSTFSIDVDTASYSFVRGALNQGQMPQKDAVRVEEMINYFDYHYPTAEHASEPFKPTVAIYPTPWNKNTKLLHIGIKCHEIVADKKPHSNLVFLLDVSGSMESPDKLPLLRNAFSMMVENLDPQDTVAIVTYAGNAGTVLEPTKVQEKQKILSALDQLHAGGSTAGAQGILQAYALAEQNFDKDGVNRVILATDGDFNVGITNQDELKGFIERKRDSGIFLSVLGFGRGNYNDALMQTLAQNGNGNAAYIDTLSEARKVLVEEAGSTLFPIAKDVKIQIEFNPDVVSEYRLIGYETRMLKREDFNNDKVDAGDIGSGHTVTAIYEITPKGSTAEMIDGLRYQKEAKSEKKSVSASGEYGFLKIRYKLPKEDTSKLIERPITQGDVQSDIQKESDDVRFAASVAAFGQLLRGDTHMGSYSFDDIINLANGAKGADEFGYRSEFVNLVRLAKSSKPM